MWGGERIPGRTRIAKKTCTVGSHVECGLCSSAALLVVGNGMTFTMLQKGLKTNYSGWQIFLWSGVKITESGTRNWNSVLCKCTCIYINK